jgi:hypothetical protein
VKMGSALYWLMFRSAHAGCIYLGIDTTSLQKLQVQKRNFDLMLYKRMYQLQRCVLFLLPKITPRAI